MGLWNKIKFWKAWQGGQLMVQPFFKNVSFSQFTDEERAEDLIKHFVHWVYICVTKNASAMASVPLRMYVTSGAGDGGYKYLRKGIDTRAVNRKRLDTLKASPMIAHRLNKSVATEEVVEHPFLDLWTKVNPWFNGFEMVELIDMYLELTGDAYLYIVKDAFGVPVELWNLPSQYMTIVPDKRDFIKGYFYGATKHDAVALAPEEVIHFKFPNPHTPFKGFSPVRGGLSAIVRKEDMDALEDSLLRNNARPDYLILAKKKMGTEDKQALREQWQQMYGTRKTRGRPALLDGADAEIKELSFSPREMQFVLGQKFSKEEIAGAFGVPVSKLVPDAKYANAEIGDREWKADTIRPRLRRIEDKINEQLMPMYDTRLFAAFDNPVPEDRDFAFKKQESFIRNSVITVNEVRESEGMEPAPWGAVPLVPMSTIPLGSYSSYQSEEETESESESELEQLSVRPRLAVAKTKLARPPMDRLGEMVRIMRGVYRDMEAEVMRRLREGKSIKATRAETYWFMPDLDQWVIEVGERMDGPIKSTLVTGGQYGMDRLRTGMRFDVTDPHIRQWMQTYVMHFSRVTTDTLARRFSKTMLEGIDSGETIYELRKRTEDFFGGMKLHQSEAIARTESARAALHGQDMAWKESGVVQGKIWRIAQDACPFCVEMEGKYTDLGKNYYEQGASMEVGGSVLTFGYEEVAAPPLHPNCLIGETPVFAPDKLAGLVAAYDGPVIEIRFADARRLAISPQHMLLTPQGFVKAHTLRQGGYVLDCPEFKRVITGDPNNDRCPARIENVIKAFAESRGVTTRSVPISPEYLHGDAAFGQGDIHVMAANSLVQNGFESARFQHRITPAVDATDVTQESLATARNLAAMLLRLGSVADGIVSRSHLDTALLRRHPRPLESFGFGLPASGNPAGEQIPLYNGPANAERLSDDILGLASEVSPVQHLAVQNNTLHHILAPFGRDIRPLQIDAVCVRHHTGYVYDLTTASSLYIANGVLSSNCRCDEEPVLIE